MVVRLDVELRKCFITTLQISFVATDRLVGY